MSAFSSKVSNVFIPFTTLMNQLPLGKPSHLTFDMSGVLSLVGGYDAVSSIIAVHVYGNKRWLGWYNNPGSFQIASSLGKSVTLFGIFSTGNSSAKALQQGDHKGPRFRAAHSGTVIEETGYLAALFMKECTSWGSEGKVVRGRRTQPVSITVVDLGQAPSSEMRPVLSSATTSLSASIPIFTSVGTSALCAFCGDWYVSSLILLGIIASGVSSLVLGSAEFVFNHPEPAKGSPSGDGILTSNKDIVILRGSEGAVNSITRGTFSFRFSNQRHYSLVRLCSSLFLVQALAQLLFISQASQFGQIMFLASLTVSALYNSRVSLMDEVTIHQKLLFESVLENPTLTKYILGTRPAATVFMLLVLQLKDPTELLNELLPSDSKNWAWRQWKATIVERLRNPNDKSFGQLGAKVEDLEGFTPKEKYLSQILYDDARSAYNGYRDYLRVDRTDRHDHYSSSES